jgi:hypothetical protein
MTADEITQRESELYSIPMGPERWDGEFELTHEKALCPEYKHDGQAVPFREWMAALRESSKTTGVDWDEVTRSEYYEGQPETWLSAYDDGLTPEEAISADMEYWEA